MQIKDVIKVLHHNLINDHIRKQSFVAIQRKSDLGTFCSVFVPREVYHSWEIEKVRKIGQCALNCGGQSGKSWQHSQSDTGRSGCSGPDWIAALDVPFLSSPWEKSDLDFASELDFPLSWYWAPGVRGKEESSRGWASRRWPSFWRTYRSRRLDRRLVEDVKVSV